MHRTIYKAQKYIQKYAISHIFYVTVVIQDWMYL